MVIHTRMKKDSFCSLKNIFHLSKSGTSADGAQLITWTQILWTLLKRTTGFREASDLSATQP